MPTIRQMYAMEPNPDFCTKDVFLAGLECEIESVRNPAPYGIFTVTTDNSLRNQGYEFVSMPAARDVLETGFKKLHTELKFFPEHDPFSVRTSTHVHVNCLELTDDEVKTMVLLYALFEDFFFMMVKPNRKDNIHCVPLTFTPLPMHYKKNLHTYIKVWSKYTALNLKRLTDLGTVEFRHLHGTNDPKELSDWLMVLENLWLLCQTEDVDARSLGDKPTIALWFDRLFENVPYIWAMKPNLFEIVQNNLIDVKLSV
jgi:hypothetical protein